MTATYYPKYLDHALCNSYTALARDCTDNYIDVNWRTSTRCRKCCEDFIFEIDQLNFFSKQKRVQIT